MELDDQAAVFDQPEGRVAEVVAIVDDELALNDVEAFYEQALPQFGWARVGPRLFQRTDERLELSFETVIGDENQSETGENFLRILVKPVSLQ